MQRNAAVAGTGRKQLVSLTNINSDWQAGAKQSKAKQSKAIKQQSQLWC